MFNLNRAMKDWQENFADNEQINPTEIEELRNHLEDEIENCKNQNLTEEEAFMVANHRLGSVDRLEQEYQMVHPNRIWQSRFIWMITGFIAVTVLNTIVRIIAKLSVFISSFITQNFALLLLIEIVSAAMFVLFLGWLAYRILFTENSKLKKYIQHGFKARYYVPIVFLISIGQFVPRLLGQSMGNIHYSNYWEVWSEYGSYLSHVSMINVLFHLLLPLIFLVLLLFVNHLARRSEGRTIKA